MSRFLIYASLLALLQVAVYPVCLSHKSTIDRQAKIDFVLPSSFTKVAALDFKGLTADFQLLQAIFFIGEKFGNDEQLSDKDWRFFKSIVWAVLDLDPYFADVYYFAPTLLVWGPQRYEDALKILKKGLCYRKNDFRIPYMMGFIYFYFLKDNEKGAEYLKMAAQRPGAPRAIYTKLASRLAYYAGDYHFSLNILDSMLSREKNRIIRKLYIKRRKAILSAIYLEKAVSEYKKQRGKLPPDVKTLVEEKFIKRIPKDPYGGSWIIMKNGRVFSTSKFSEAYAEIKKQP